MPVNVFSYPHTINYGRHRSSILLMADCGAPVKNGYNADLPKTLNNLKKWASPCQYGTAGYRERMTIEGATLRRALQNIGFDRSSAVGLGRRFVTNDYKEQHKRLTGEIPSCPPGERAGQRAARSKNTKPRGRNAIGRQRIRRPGKDLVKGCASFGRSPLIIHEPRRSVAWRQCRSFIQGQLLQVQPFESRNDGSGITAGTFLSCAG